MHDHPTSIALATVAEDIVFTQARLEAHAETQPLASAIAKLLAKVDAIQAEHTALQRAISKADAVAAGARADIEAFCEDLQNILLALVAQDRQAPLFRTYFAQAASTIQALDEAGLRKWLDGVATALTVAAEKALKVEAAKAKKLLASWTAAETAQAAAGTANSQHDASQRVPLRTAVNAGRRDLHADLTKLAVKSNRNKRWVESFFRKGRGPKPAAVV